MHGAIYRFYQFKHKHLLCSEYFGVNGTFVLGLGASGLRMGPLLCFPADPLSGPNFLLDVMLSRMFVARG